jgi:hypothetical protein
VKESNLIRDFLWCVPLYLQRESLPADRLAMGFEVEEDMSGKVHIMFRRTTVGRHRVT